MNITSSRIASRPFPTPEGVSSPNTGIAGTPVPFVCQGSQSMHVPNQQGPGGAPLGNRVTAAADLPPDVAEILETGNSQVLANALTARRWPEGELKAIFAHNEVVTLLLQDGEAFEQVATHPNIPTNALDVIFGHRNVAQILAKSRDIFIGIVTNSDANPYLWIKLIETFPDTVELLFEDMWVFMRVVINPRTPEHALDEILNHREAIGLLLSEVDSLQRKVDLGETLTQVITNQGIRPAQYQYLCLWIKLIEAGLDEAVNSLLLDPEAFGQIVTNLDITECALDVIFSRPGAVELLLQNPDTFIKVVTKLYISTHVLGVILNHSGAVQLLVKTQEAFIKVVTNLRISANSLYVIFRRQEAIDLLVKNPKAFEGVVTHSNISTGALHVIFSHLGAIDLLIKNSDTFIKVVINPVLSGDALDAILRHPKAVELLLQIPKAFKRVVTHPNISRDSVLAIMKNPALIEILEGYEQLKRCIEGPAQTGTILYNCNMT